MNHAAVGLQFVPRARAALAATGLSCCNTREVSVVLFDSAAWIDLEPDACILLDANERQRAARFRFERDRCVYVLAHAMWRVVLGVSINISPSEVPLSFLPSGQPQISGARFTTSLSHSGTVVLIAVGEAAALGIDVERWPPRVAMESLLPMICSPEERGPLRALQPEQRNRELLQLWTRKEALLKAWGTGLQQAPAGFWSPSGGIVLPPQGLIGVSCRAIDLILPTGQLGALAVSLEVARYRLHALA